VARDTVNALKSGFFYGWISLVQGMINRIEKDYGKSFRIIFTGGLADKIAFSIERPVVLDRLLTMKGIKYIYDSNTNR
jgi:type III pantothenate kinase